MKRCIIILLLFACAALALVIGAVVTNPLGFVQTYASHALGHTVTIGKLNYNLHPLSIDAEDIHVANPPWAKGPDMVKIGHVTAQSDFTSLLSGNPVFTSMRVSDAMVSLERDENGTGNWKQGGASNASPEEKAAEGRKAFPAILDLAVENSSVTMRTAKGALLDVAFHEFHLETPDSHQPARIDVKGSYNRIPVTLHIETGSYDQLHDSANPIPLNINAEGATAKISAKVQAMDPLNFDDFTGEIKAHISDVGKAAALIAGSFEWNKSFTLISEFARKGDEWKLADAKGDIENNRFSESNVEFTEGKRNEPDKVKTSLSFARIDMISLTGNKTTDTGLQNITLSAEETPPVLVDATIAASEMLYKKFAGTHVKLRARMEAGLKQVEIISLTLFDSIAQASLAAKSDGKTNKLALTLTIAKADTAALLKGFGFSPELLSGKADLELTAKATGNNAEQWRRTTDGSLRLTMKNGEIARNAVRFAATDIRAVLAPDQSPVAMPCMVAAMNFKNGVGLLSPLQITTGEGVIEGAGELNLPESRMNFVVKSDAETTSGLALDVPIHITGALGSPKISPFGRNDPPVRFADKIACH